MGRNKTLREAANGYAFDLEEGDLNTNRDTFIAGAEWAINKACEFLKSYRRDYPDCTGYVAGIIDDETIEDFKKYMEE